METKSGSDIIKTTWKQLIYQFSQPFPVQEQGFSLKWGYDPVTMVGESDILLYPVTFTLQKSKPDPPNSV